MYQEYWKLTRKPFENNSDTEFYYPSDSHQGAMLKLRYAVENTSGCALVTGAPGLGKSLIIQALFEHLPKEVNPRVNLVFPQMPTDQLLAYIADELSGKVSKSTSTVDESIRRIQKQIHDNRLDGKSALLVIDEAHLLEDENTLETLRLLLNFDFAGKPGLTLILCGQPNLLPVLERHPGIEERMAVKCLLRPFTNDETAAYISHRLQKSGGNPAIFTQSAVETIHAISTGVPRKINRLCDLSLLIGYAENFDSIDADQIEAVSDELVTVIPE